MLKERRENPLVMLAVHMRVLSYVQAGIPRVSSWVHHREEDLCQEDVVDFLANKQMREWFANQPVGLKGEYETIVRESLGFGPFSHLLASSGHSESLLQDLYGFGSDSYKGWLTMRDLERTNNMLARHQAPLHIAEAVNNGPGIEYDGDYRRLLFATNVTIASNYPYYHSQFPFPQPTFLKLVLHVFIRCVSEGYPHSRSSFHDLRFPPSTSCSTIFPAYSTLETHRDAILKGAYQSRYLTEASNPGIARGTGVAATLKDLFPVSPIRTCRTSRQ
ncbi:hypothetical protein PQX77_012861 [Marasmius sp. AFHP31]|nr:hypothetical protein PQX77_012861 [Marasmius sp. AFHP31]